MRILVTGNLGYVGTLLVPLLQAAEHDVVGMDTDLYRDCTFVSAPPPVRQVRKDIRDARVRDLAGFEAVVHLAALSNDPLSYLDAEQTRDINTRGAIRLAETAREAGVRRFVFSSSCRTYSAAGPDLVDEDTPVHPVTLYGSSKTDAESGIRALACEGFSPTILRNGTVYGLSPRIRFDLVVNNLLAYAFATGEVFLKSTGRSSRPMLHVEDMARAFAAVVDAPVEIVHDRIYNVGRTEENYTVRELADLVAAAVPGARVVLAPDAFEDPLSYRVNCDRIRAELAGFRPRWTVPEGIAQLCDAYERVELKVEDFEGARFARAGQIEKLWAEGVLGRDFRWTRRSTASAPSQNGVYEAQTVCRSCARPGPEPVLDLGASPLADRLVSPARTAESDPVAPLEVAFCPSCSLVQLTVTVDPDVLFDEEYPYFASVSETRVADARATAERLIREKELGPGALVVEAASNDGYMLRPFREHGIDVLGIDPSAAPAEVANEQDIPTLVTFFTDALAERLRQQGRRADAFVANNVLAHVPDINGFVRGMATLLKPGGTALVEVGYVGDLVDQGEFDTIYHQHLCYYSLTAADRLFRRNGLFINRVERIPAQGGSLRLHAGPHEAPEPSVRELLAEERAKGMDRSAYYRDFADRACSIREELRTEIHRIKQAGGRIAGYGAAAKAATLMAYCGIDGATLDYVVDANPFKQGRLMPGTRLPIHAPAHLLDDMPDFVLLFAWNLKDEILRQQRDYLDQGGRFLIPLPTLEVV